MGDAEIAAVKATPEYQQHVAELDRLKAELEPPCSGSTSGEHCTVCERHGYCCMCIDAPAPATPSQPTTERQLS